MVENLFKRAKAFIGLEEENEEERNFGQQMDMGPLLRNKKENKSGDVNFEIIIYEPKVYEDSLNISSHLRTGSPVIINLKHLDPNEGTRLIDFVCGMPFAQKDEHAVLDDRRGDCTHRVVRTSVGVVMPHSHIAKNIDIQFNEIIEIFDFWNQNINGWKCLAKLK